MSKHIELKRLTWSKTEKMADNNLKALAKNFKEAESASAELATAVRDGKVILKNLDEVRKSTDGKKKDKDKVSGYKKECELIDKMDSKLDEIDNKSNNLTTKMATLYSNTALEDKVAGGTAKKLNGQYKRKLTATAVADSTSS